MTKDSNQIKNTEPEVEIEQTIGSSPLDNAPDDIKLAVDLIYLLESNEVEKETAIKALEMVLSDFKKK